jgi:hypothetical protein
MTRQPERWYFLLGQEAIEEHSHIQGAAGLLDMLRYTSAVVESNGPEHFWMLSTPHWSRNYESRFMSFGIQIYGPWPSRVGEPYELTKWAEAYNAPLKENYNKKVTRS